MGAELLGAAEIDSADLRGYDGTSLNAVRVGTYLRAKVLEFKCVFIPRVDVVQSYLETAEEDRAQVLRRRLFVAMARARDGLWVGSGESRMKSTR